MSVDISIKHPSFGAHNIKSTRCRDCYEGTDAVKEKEEVYLPSLGGQSKSEYEAYITRALFYNATKRTIKGLVGSIMRKDPVINVPSKLDSFLENCDGKGTSFLEKVPSIIEEVIMTGRLGIVVEREKEGGTPYINTYKAENSINWIESGGDISTAVFSEFSLEQDIKNPYKQFYVEQYREIAFDSEFGIVVRVWQKKGKGKGSFVIVDESILSKKGKRLDILPVTYITASGDELGIDNPPILDIVDVNLSHYRTYADLEHGRHWTALPTPYFSGLELDENESITIGSGSAIIMEDPLAKAGFIEFTGNGLKALENALSQKENQMATLGAKMVEGQRAGVEAAETARINKSGEVASLSELSNSISTGIVRILKIVAYWEGVDEASLDDIFYNLNKDFVDVKMEPAALKGLVEAFQVGAISVDTFLYNLQKGEILPPGTDIEDEKLALEISEQKRVDQEMADLESELADTSEE